MPRGALRRIRAALGGRLSSSLPPSLFVFGLLLLPAGLSACKRELGECDINAATQVVFFDSGSAVSAQNGVPMYAGQALTHVSCGSGQFCHSADATRAERYGVPDGLFFDVAYGCDEGPCAPEDEGVARLALNQARVLDNARGILTTIHNGRMPPGGIGAEIVEQAGRFRVVDVARAESFTLYRETLPCGHPLTSCAPSEGSEEVDTPLLPRVGTPGANEIIRNWLACGAPVVESTAADVANPPGSHCKLGSGTGHAGDCVYRILVPPEPPAQRWSAIYADVIEPLCGTSCHGSGTPNFIDESQLDLSTAAIAYEALINAEAAGDACRGQGTLVVPGDAAGSLLIDKLLVEPSCGDPMPTRGAVLPTEVVDVIRAWIDAGAPSD